MNLQNQVPSLPLNFVDAKSIYSNGLYIGPHSIAMYKVKLTFVLATL